MKCIDRNYRAGMKPKERIVAKQKARDMVLTRGTGRVPLPPRDVQVQSGPRGLLVSWKLPAGYWQDISGWRVYKDTESTLYEAINDVATRQCFIETTAASTSPTANVFISSVSQFGKESAKAQAQGAAENEASAPAMPSSPPEYTSTYSGGGSYGGGVVKQT